MRFVSQPLRDSGNATKMKEFQKKLSSFTMKVYSLILLTYVLLGAYSFPIGLFQLQNWPKFHSESQSTCHRLDSCCRRPWSSRLFASPSSKVQAKVVFQKVLRPPKGLEDIVFLGHLVEYLQEKYQLPSKLPMVYEKSSLPESDDHDRSILKWNSPLSPNPAATCLSVEVIGIYTDANTVPNMAMVVVRKDQKNSLEQSPALMQNLFADSEKKILKSLERGLEDFEAGRVKLSSSDDKQSYTEAQTAMLAEVMEEDKVRNAITRPQPENAIDAKITDSVAIDEKQHANLAEPPAIVKQKQEAVLKTMRTKAETTPEPAGLDFAVQAARKAAAKRKNENDYAVEAARKVAARRKQVDKPVIETEKLNENLAEDENQAEEINNGMDLRGIRPPMLDYNAGSGRAFSTTISKPGEFRKKDKAKSIDESLQSQSTKLKTSARTMDTKDSVSGTATKSAHKSSRQEAKFDSQETRGSDTPDIENIVKITQDALRELEQQEKDITPEELLEDVMKFNEQNERENTVGGAFAYEAFEKAKDLLREQKERRDERQRTKVVEKVANAFKIVDVSDDTHQNVKTLSVEEELRQMFEAGERIADGRISLAEASTALNAGLDPSSDQELNKLIAADKSVSSYARILDDELAELEIRINKSPGEELDGFAKNPIFDIFSGPEIFNPNVDPETAVNWPGAQRGTRNVRLPKELDEAVKQARFAADVLSKVQESEDDNGNVNYSIGEKDLSARQVEDLRLVVTEAVEIGIIQDPLLMIEERARLQMLLDELWMQPEERLREIASNYRDLLLSENFVPLVKERLRDMADRDLVALQSNDNALESNHARAREILGQLVVYAQLLLKEVQALGAELEAQQLEIIRSICKVAMDPSYRTEEDAAMALSDTVRDMRPLFDDAFVAYMKYAIAEEEGRLSRAGLLDDPNECQWLMVLKIVQQGVYAEISQSVNRYVDHIWYVLRMETPTERRMLLKKLIDVMPTLDVRPFVQVVDNIVGTLGKSAIGEFDGGIALGEMTNKLLQLRRDVKDLLPAERIAEMSRDADEWAAKRKEKLLQRRKLTQQRIAAARETEHLDQEIESLGRRGEMERLT